MTKLEYLEKTKEDLTTVPTTTKLSNESLLNTTEYMYRKLTKKNLNWKTPEHLINVEWDLHKPVTTEDVENALKNYKNSILKKIEEIENTPEEEFNKIFAEKIKAEEEHDAILQEFDQEVEKIAQKLNVSPEELDELLADKDKFYAKAEELNIPLSELTSWVKNPKWSVFD